MSALKNLSGGRVTWECLEGLLSDVENATQDGLIAAFKAHRQRIEQIASGAYDAGQPEPTVTSAYI
jgi:hypothetical protein